MKILKKWWFWLIILVLIIGISTCRQDTPTEPTPNQADQSNEATPTEAPIEETEEKAQKETEKAEKPANKPTISKEEFDKIEIGMTYEQVKEIIGSDGEVISESGEKGTELHTIMYQWKGEGSLGANANFLFQNNQLQNKAQFGLD